MPMYYTWNWWWVLSWVIPMLLFAWVIFGTNYRRYSGGRDFERYRDYWDDDTARPREPRLIHNRGKGPRNYVRSDERIHEDVCDRLLVDERLDATAIEVHAGSGIVTLSGTVANRSEKRVAERIAEAVPGVKDVDNRLRIGDVAPAPLPANQQPSASLQDQHA